MLVLALSPAASGSPLLTLRDDGSTLAREDPYLPADADPAAAAPATSGRVSRSSRGASSASPGATPAAGALVRAARAPRRTVGRELERMLAAGAIDQATYDARRATYVGARRLHRKLKGARRNAMGAVLANLDAVAARGELTVSRLPALFETVARNRQWWANGPLLSHGRRVSFQSSPLVWQHYTGEGLQIQWLGTFGKANALWKSGTHDEDLRTLLDAALALAAQRAGGIAFEYLLHFDGGRPPWASGLAQATGVQALSRAAIRLGDPRYFEAARSALGIFREAPPAGVRVNTPVGAHYLIYSFAPALRVLNGFTQAVNGLHDFALLANDAEGRALFAAGEAQLRAELPAYDTGAWSRYSLRREADLSYHKLARDFLVNLCTRLEDDAARVAGTAPVAAAQTGGVAPQIPLPTPPSPMPDATPYCAAATRFSTYLRQPPAIALVSRRARAGRRAVLRMTLSKPSYVKLAVQRAERTLVVLNARLGSGRQALVWKHPRAGRKLTVLLRATDLAGNVGSARGELDVLKARKRSR